MSSFAFATRRPAVYTSLALVLLFVGLWLWLPKVYTLSDPVGYLLRAWNLAGIGEWGAIGYRRWAFEWARIAEADILPFDHRLGLLLPHWAAYQLFGGSRLVSFLPQLGFLLLTLFCVLHYCRNLLQRLGAAAVLLLLLPFAADVMPDLGVGCMMFVALHCLIQGRQVAGVEAEATTKDKQSSRRQMLYGVLFSLAAFYAFLIKLTAYFLLLPFLFVLVTDLLRGRSAVSGAGTAHDGAALEHGSTKLRGNAMRFYLAAILSGLTLLAAYLLFCHLIYGDALSRLETVNRVAERHLWNIAGSQAYLSRLFIAPGRFFFEMFGIAFLLALVQSARIFWQGWRRGQEQGRQQSQHSEQGALKLMAFYFLSGTVFAVFSPTSLVNWQPLPLSERMFLFLTPIIAVLAARLIGDLWCAGFRGGWLGLAAGHWHSRLSIIAARASAIALLLAAAYPGALAISEHSVAIRSDQARQMAMQLLRENDDALLLVADDRTYEHLIIYAGFDEALYSRVRHCDAEPVLAGSNSLNNTGGIIYVDKPLGDFIQRAYGRRNCSDELLQLAAAQNYETLMEQGGIYLLVQPSFEQPED